MKTSTQNATANTSANAGKKSSKAKSSTPATKVQDTVIAASTQAAPVVADATVPASKKDKVAKVPAAPKEKRVTNTDKAQVIWLEELAKRQAGVYNTPEIKFPNRAFRRVVLDRFVAEVEGKDGFISMASASTIFNKLKEDADALTKDGVNALLSVNGVYSSLGRDPKVVVIKEPKAPKAAKTAPAATEAPATVETAQQEEAVA